MKKTNISTNPLKSEGVVTVNGTEYKIEFNMRGLSDAEDATGLSLITGLSQTQMQQPRIKLVWALFYGLAKKHTPSLTYDAVQDLVTPLNLKDIWQPVIEVYLSAWQAPKNE
ncbi:MAG TPA: hypothetical protein VGI45_09080 [Terracidiphilus sp.]|jgi:hypothetical protein